MWIVLRYSIVTFGSDFCIGLTRRAVENSLHINWSNIKKVTAVELNWKYQLISKFSLVYVESACFDIISYNTEHIFVHFFLVSYFTYTNFPSLNKYMNWFQRVTILLKFKFPYWQLALSNGIEQHQQKCRTLHCIKFPCLQSHYPQHITRFLLFSNKNIWSFVPAPDPLISRYRHNYVVCMKNNFKSNNHPFR